MKLQDALQAAFNAGVEYGKSWRNKTFKEWLDANKDQINKQFGSHIHLIFLEIYKSVDITDKDLEDLVWRAIERVENKVKIKG